MHMMHGAGYYLDKYQRRFEGEFLYGTFNSAMTYVSANPPELPGQRANEALALELKDLSDAREAEVNALQGELGCLQPQALRLQLTGDGHLGK